MPPVQRKQISGIHGNTPVPCMYMHMCTCVCTCFVLYSYMYIGHALSFRCNIDMRYIISVPCPTAVGTCIYVQMVIPVIGAYSSSQQPLYNSLVTGCSQRHPKITKSRGILTLKWPESAVFYFSLMASKYIGLCTSPIRMKWRWHDIMPWYNAQQKHLHVQWNLSWETTAETTCFHRPHIFSRRTYISN